MPRAVWDDVGERTFETGVDRGMLYVGSDPGVAWNGLVKISEAPSGGSAREFYLDGDKYMNLVGLEEYTATVEAFSCPGAFDPCIGIMKLSPGLFSCNQSRQPFGFSYRTMMGDDILGAYGNYQIHLVYNVTAKTSDFVNETVTERPGIKSHMWTITTTPLWGASSKPTSHFVIESAEYDPVQFSAVEDILYGTSTTNPRMLTVAELLALVEVG